jgi:hypothetical protein
MLYAKVEDRKVRAQRGQSGLCPLCGGEVIAKCGSLRAWHWAHKSLVDCDAWSEPVGPWHLSWQNLVRPEFVEVAIGPHRADIVGDGGDGGRVIELQHSPIAPEEIAEREAFYGDMLWLFDATHRFAAVRSGAWCFFSLGRTRHLATCGKPVVLDFGEHLVQIASLGEPHAGLSGFGRVRDRRWFLDEHLSQVRAAVPLPPIAGSASVSTPSWPGGQPWRVTEHASRWMDPRRGARTIVPRGTLYIPLTISKTTSSSRATSTWTDAIFRHDDLSGGWRKHELHSMQQFLDGTPMILVGRLRLMPQRADRIRVTQTVRAVERLLAQVDRHVQAGRIAVLKHETKLALLKRAEQFEIDAFGAPLGFPQYQRGRTRLASGRRDASA